MRSSLIGAFCVDASILSLHSPLTITKIGDGIDFDEAAR